MLPKNFVITTLGFLLFVALSVFCFQKASFTPRASQHHHHHTCCHHDHAVGNHTHGSKAIAQPCNIIFDFNGVLFNISRSKAVGKLGFGKLLSYTFSGNDAHDLENKMFELLYSLDGKPSVQGDTLIPLHKDKPLPNIMCRWLRGEITGEEVIKTLHNHITKLDQENFFESSAEKKLITNLVDIFFDTSVRATLYKPLKKGIALLKKCKNEGHKVYLLSNIDQELINLLQEKHPDLFNLFDGIVVSSTVGMMKPDANIYRYTLSHFSLDPATCCFIDDQPENIQGARNAGIQGVVFDHEHYRQAYKQLAHLGVIQTSTRAPDNLQIA